MLTDRRDTRRCGREVMISGNNAVRLFTVGSGIFLTASNLVLANGLHLGTMAQMRWERFRLEMGNRQQVAASYSAGG